MKQLSPAQRTMLHNAVHGKPLLLGLTRNSVGHRTHSTLQALHRAGMLAGIDHRPTAVGLAYFGTNTRPHTTRGAPHGN